MIADLEPLSTLSRRIKMTAACEAYGIKLASNQIEFNLARTLPLMNGLLRYMKEKEIACLACERSCGCAHSAFSFSEIDSR
jgi:predicted oxidoreductase